MPDNASLRAQRQPPAVRQTACATKLSEIDERQRRTSESCYTPFRGLIGVRCHEEVSPVMGRAHCQLAICANGLLGSCPKGQRALVPCNRVRPSRSRGGRQAWLSCAVRGILRHDLSVHFARAVGRLHQNALNQTAAFFPAPSSIAWRCRAKRALAQSSACQCQIAKRSAASYRRSKRGGARAGT